MSTFALDTAGRERFASGQPPWRLLPVVNA